MLNRMYYVCGALFLTVVLAGCGGGNSGSHDAVQAANKTAFATLIHVNMTAGTVTYTPIGSAPSGGSSRAVFGATSVVVSGPTTLVTDNGDPAVFSLNITITNNLGAPYGVPIGQFPTNQATAPSTLQPGVRAIITGFSSILPTNLTPTPTISISNPDGYVPDVVSSTGVVSAGPMPYLVYPTIPSAGTTGQTGVVTVNPNNKQTRAWSFVVSKGVTSFNFTVVVEGPAAIEAPPEGEPATSANIPATVRTYAGKLMTSGFVDGIAAVGRFTAPRQAAADAAGNLYVADGHAIRRVTPLGTTNTILDPADLAVGSLGVMQASGTPTTGDVTALISPTGIAVDSGGDTIYVADPAANAIVRMFLTGSDPTKAGSWSITVIAGLAVPTPMGTKVMPSATGASVQFNSPQGVALDASGNLYVADTGGNRVWRMTYNGAAPSGTPAGASIASNWNALLLSGSQIGSSGYQDSTKTSMAATFSSPSGITMNQAGTAFVCDAGTSIIRQISPDGYVTTIAGSSMATGNTDSTTGASATFNKPQALVCDASGYLYVADTMNNAVRRVAITSVISPSTGFPIWAVETVAGPGSGAAAKSGAQDGTATAALFNGPSGIAVDGSGNLYVNDTGNSAIRLIQRMVPGS